MILHGKAKEDFERWVYKNYRKYALNYHNNHLSIFTDLTEQMTNALIIEWFDSVNISICIKPYYCENNLYFKQYILGHKDISEQNTYLDRNSATTEAIKKAVEIHLSSAKD